VIISAIGIAYAAGGAATLSSTPTCAPSAGLCLSSLNTVLGATLVGVSVVHLATGLALVGVGLTPKKGEDASQALSLVPGVAAGPSGAKLTWAF